MGWVEPFHGVLQHLDLEVVSEKTCTNKGLIPIMIQMFTYTGH